jgi:predicted RNA binding protein YcfA (HicA-like mRNA interferase family)
MPPLTYGHLDQMLRALGFTYSQAPDSARVYKHASSGAGIVFPGYPEDQEVYPWHIAAARATLEGFGLPCPPELYTLARRVS